MEITMKTIKRACAAIALTALVAALHGPGVLAQSGGGYDLTWNDVEGSGAVSTGSGYELFGVTGQHDAGPMSGGNYTLAGGFLVPPTYQAYLPVVLRP
jgi:hypothetical protein